MKKTNKFLLIALIVLTLSMSTVLVGCPKSPEPTIWKVTFNYNYTGAPAAAVVDVKDGETVAVPTPAPERGAGYTFKGWFTDSACTAAFVFTTAITADRTLYAGWINPNATVWKVTFNLAYAGAPPVTVVNVEDGETVAAPSPAPERGAGYTFKGWFTTAAAATAFVFSTPITADIALYAGWESDVAPWKVTFNYNYTGAPDPNIVDVVDGATVPRPAVPARPAQGGNEYDFTGWFTTAAGGTVFNFTTPIKADTTLYAGWKLAEIFEPDPEIAQINFASSVTALEGTWKLGKVYTNTGAGTGDGRSISNAVADAITLEIELQLNPWKLVDGIAYIHNQVYDVNGVMTFGLPAINAELAEDDIESYDGLASWEDFSLGEVAPEDEFYKQPGPAIIKFGSDIRYYGLFLDLVAGVSVDINTYKSDLIIGMNSDGQLLLGYSDKSIEYPGVKANWNYCLIFDKA